MQLSIPYMNTRCLVQPPQNKLSLFEMVQHAKIEVSVTFLQATSYLFLYFYTFHCTYNFNGLTVLNYRLVL